MNVLRVRNTKTADFPAIMDLCAAVYPGTPTWSEVQLQSHLDLYPEGQFVAIDDNLDKIVGMSASLIVDWEDYNFKDSWKSFTDSGLFTNHDPIKGRTLYGAEIMVHPDAQGSGVGSLLYEARENFVVAKKLLRIRAGARLRGYSVHAPDMGAEDYVLKVIQGSLFDPTLSFQLKRGFRVLHVVSEYLKYDAESLGYAAVIEWLNQEVAETGHYLKGNPKFQIAGKWPS